MVKAFKQRGFAFIEIISPCPSNFGRRNNVQDIRSFRTWLKEYTRPISKSEYGKYGKNLGEFIDRDEKEDKLTVGEFISEERETFEEKWRKTCQMAKEQYFKLKMEE